MQINIQVLGGRGQNYTIINRLPNFKKAIFPRNKFKNYILNPNKEENKAKYFESLGYNMKNYKLLQEHIMQKLATNKSLKYETDSYGNTAYQVNMELGLSKKEIVTTAWIILKGEDKPRFVSAYKNQSKYFKVSD